MQFVDSKHWKKRKLYRKDITDEFIIYAIESSSILRDKYWSDALNAICRISPSGRLLKVIYKRISKDKVKIISAFWLD